MKNKLIIFDVDGTLTKTNNADSIFFEKAVIEVFKLTSIDKQWENYRYSSDSGMLSEIIHLKLNREMVLNDIETVKNIFINHLESAFSENPEYCLPITGAQTIFDRVKQHGWDIAIATGCWERSALLKLKTANIINHVPIAHSDDHMERESIIKIAIERAMQHYEKLSYSNIVYVGDRNWDKKAAENNKIDFIGIGKAFHGDTNYLRHIEDYADNKLLEYLTHL